MSIPGFHKITNLHSRRGAIVLMTAFFFSIILGALAFNVLRMTRFQSQDRGRYEIYKSEFAAAEEALNQVFSHVQFLVRNDVPNLTTQIDNTPQPSIEGYTIRHYTMSKETDGDVTINSGQWEGLTLKRIKYKATLQVRSNSDADNDRFSHPGIRLSQEFVVTYIPIFNFAIFYDPVMEIAPGPEMTINGRVHVNSDAYIQANSSLTFEDRVTVSGNIYHGRHPDSGKSDSGGNVYFTKDGEGSYENMKMSGDENGDGWLDYRDTDWTTKAKDRWDGWVKDKNHGVVPLGLPIPPVADNRTIIERKSSPSDPDYSQSKENAKYENKADVVIARVGSGSDIDTDIIAYRQNSDGTTTTLPLQYFVDTGDSDSDGDTTEIISGPVPNTTDYVQKSIVEVTDFRDKRQDKNSDVNVIDINVENMLEYDGCNPANGILYVSNGDDTTGGDAGVRLKNGSQLPVATGTTGLTVATNNPIYIQGDYNTQDSPTLGKRPMSMVAGDAINVLSNAWDDDDSSSNLSSRVATETTINSVLINGIVPSEDDTYSGGVENYFRFLEKWSGVDFNFSGSVIELYESKLALGKWGQNDVYSAPNRPWSWDTALGGIDGPPGAPRVVEIIRANWKIEDSED